MNTSTTVTAVQLHPIVSSEKFDVRLSDDGSLLLYREDNGACVVDVKLTPEQITEIRQASN
jgi:hypothetical protein